MRLTNTIRDAFVRAAMHDVPKEMDHSEEIRKIVLNDFLTKLPAKVKAVYDDIETRHWIKTDYNNYGGVSVSYPTSESRSSWNAPKLTPSAQKKVDELKEKSESNEKIRKTLESKLHQVAYSVTTRKQLVDALPEFEKYLPEDEAKAIRTLPVVTNVVADFVKAGWPKDQKKAGKK